MKALNRGFSSLNDDEMYHQATAIVAAVGANAKFSTLSASLPPITAAANALAAGNALPEGKVREATVASARANLTMLLQHLADALEIVPGVTEADLAGTGFALREANTHTSAPPEAPQNVRLKVTGIGGELQILLNAVPRAALYEVESTLDPVNGPWTLAPAFTSTRGMTLTGLTRGKDYYLRVRAVATGQNRGPWSDLANALAM